MISINQNVITGFQPFGMPRQYSMFTPPLASPACLSQVEQTPFVNRCPQHEPWPRTLLGNTENSNSRNDECLRNTHFYPQFNDDGSAAGSQPIGRIEGTETIERGNLWRR